LIRDKMESIKEQPREKYPENPDGPPNETGGEAVKNPISRAIVERQPEYGKVALLEGGGNCL
jgi:hypothetical protein